MDTQDRFKRAEEEYSRLKSQLAAGQITQTQFDSALKALTVQDEQGRTWTLGDNGYWSAREGPSGTTPPPTIPVTKPTPQPLPRSRVVVPVIAAGCLVLLCLVGAAALMFAPNLPMFKVSLAATATATPVQAPTVSVETPTLIPTIERVTATVAPTIAAPTVAAVITPTVVLTPTAAIPPGVYVTGLRLEPAAPVRRQDIRFFPMFLNTAGGTQNFRWLVYIYKVDGQKNSLGETASIVTGIPVGPGEQNPGGGWRLTGGGNCENFIARVAWLDSGKKPTFFNKPDGSLFEMTFAVC